MANIGCRGTRECGAHADRSSLLEARAAMGPRSGLTPRHHRHGLDRHFTRRIARLCMDADPAFRDLAYHALALSLGPDSLDFRDVAGDLDLSSGVRYLPVRNRGEAAQSLSPGRVVICRKATRHFAGR